MLLYNYLSFLILSFFLYGCGIFPPVTSEVDTNIGLTSITYSSSSSNDFNPKDIEPAGNKISVDFLFVADTSYPMVKHLKKVDRTFQGFISHLEPFSWRMAFTNADYDSTLVTYYSQSLLKGEKIDLELNGKILPYNFLQSSLQNNEEIFIDTLKRYEPGDLNHISNYINPCDLPPYCQGKERSPIRSFIGAVAKNDNFIREEASALVTIFFTNGDDSKIQISTVNHFFTQFNKRYGSKKQIKVYSISILPGDKACLDGDQASQYYYADSAYSENIHTLVKATGGKTISICAANYAPLAREIVKAINTSL